MLASVGTVEVGDDDDMSVSRAEFRFDSLANMRGRICRPWLNGREKDGTLDLDTAFGRGTAGPVLVVAMAGAGAAAARRGAGVGVSCMAATGVSMRSGEPGTDQSESSPSSESNMSSGGEEGLVSSSRSVNVVRKRARGTDSKHLVELTLGFGLCSVKRRRKFSNS